MTSRIQRLAPPVAIVALAALVVSGCGDGRDTDLVRGKELFVERCGSCHVLARAGTTGVTGPNLDDAFGPSRRVGMGASTVEGVVLDQISGVLRNSQMPADLVEGQDARDVAAYVGQVAGMPGEDEGKLASAGKPEVSNEPIAAAGGKLELDADPSGALAFASTAATAPAGPLQLLSMNESPIDHNIAIEAGGKVVEGEVVGSGGTSSVEIDLKPGKYEFLCTVPGHAEGGMKGQLTVK